MTFKLKSEENRDAVIAYLQALDILKVKFTVTISKIKKQRSIDQNCLYWLWIACICQETGNDKDDVHMYFREYFLGYSEKRMFGSLVRRVRSTTELDTKQFTDYLKKIKVWASRELGIALPDPNDAYFESFKEIYQNYI
ncbi:MAG: hypothetical protein H6Q17_534 [Bacteroidetes bacterium]|nr:hypothetical protein [Bacteroidota bacterium]